MMVVGYELLSTINHLTKVCFGSATQSDRLICEALVLLNLICIGIDGSWSC